MFWSRNKKINFQLHTLHWRPVSYTSAHVFIIEFFKQVGVEIKWEALPSILWLLRNMLNKFNITGAQMLDTSFFCDET